MKPERQSRDKKHPPCTSREWKPNASRNAPLSEVAVVIVRRAVVTFTEISSRRHGKRNPLVRVAPGIRNATKFGRDRYTVRRQFSSFISTNIPRRILRSVNSRERFALEIRLRAKLTRSNEVSSRAILSYLLLEFILRRSCATGSINCFLTRYELHARYLILQITILNFRQTVSRRTDKSSFPQELNTISKQCPRLER